MKQAIDDKDFEIEASFRGGQMVAAYIHLASNHDLRSARCDRVEPGLIIDFSADGRPIGIEVTMPRMITLATVNEALSSLGLRGMTAVEFSPLRAA
jgi:hypothetical protein